MQPSTSTSSPSSSAGWCDPLLLLVYLTSLIGVTCSERRILLDVAQRSSRVRRGQARVRWHGLLRDGVLQGYLGRDRAHHLRSAARGRKRLVHGPRVRSLRVRRGRALCRFVRAGDRCGEHRRRARTTADRDVTHNPCAILRLAGRRKLASTSGPAGTTRCGRLFEERRAELVTGPRVRSSRRVVRGRWKISLVHNKLLRFSRNWLRVFAKRRAARSTFLYSHVVNPGIHLHSRTLNIPAFIPKIYAIRYVLPGRGQKTYRPTGVRTSAETVSHDGLGACRSRPKSVRCLWMI